MSGVGIRSLLVLLLTIWCASAAQTLHFREMFSTTGTIASGNPGNFASFTGTGFKRAGGPSTNGIPAASMDFHHAGATYGIATMPNAPKQWVGAWFFSKEVGSSGANENYVFTYVGSLVELILKSGNYYAGVFGGDVTPLPITASNRWVFIALAISQVSGNNYDVRGYYKTVGGTLTPFSTNSNVSLGTSTHTSARLGLLSAGAAPVINGRMGGCVGYSFSNADFSDISYPADLLEPTNSITWFVNAATGNDSSDGVSPSTAWLTPGKVNAESVYCGIFPATSYVSGDTLCIDTSAAAWDLSATNLALFTIGLNVKATNSMYWTNLLSATLTNAHFTATGPANVYQIAAFNNAGFGQSNIVVWEDDKWMNHPEGATWASVSNNVSTNAGSFWTDGTTIYVHPFGDTVPTSDGKRYTRSVARDSTGAGSAINLNASDMNFRDCYAGKTGMVRSTDNTEGLGAYVVGTGGTFGGTSVVANCFLYYGSKHILGLVAQADNSDVTITNVIAEQATPTVSSSPFVSFMSGPGGLNNVHRYINCTSIHNIGLVGSTAGSSDNQSYVVMHNSSSGVQFRDVVFDGCTIGGWLSLSVCSNAIVRNCTIGGAAPNAVTSNIVVNTRFTRTGLDLSFNGASNTVVRNCIAVHTNFLSGGVWTGWSIQGGNVVIENSTVDFSGVTSAAPGQTTGLLRRSAQTSLTFRNNVITMGTNGYSIFHGFTTNDTYAISNNIYKLGTLGNMSALYTNGASGTDRTFAQWQALGFDANSQNRDPRLDSQYRPLGDSPLRDFGVSAGIATDYTGRTFANRNDAGAVEYRRATKFTGFSK